MSILDTMDTTQFDHEKILEHYHHPRNIGHLDAPDFSFEEYNHSCGDQVHIEGHIKDDIITELVFIGSGCVISQAASSMLTEACKGMSIENALALDKDFMLKLIGISLGPTRLRCALLPLYALKHGLLAYNKELESE